MSLFQPQHLHNGFQNVWIRRINLAVWVTVVRLICLIYFEPFWYLYAFGQCTFILAAACRTAISFYTVSPSWCLSFPLPVGVFCGVFSCYGNAWFCCDALLLRVFSWLRFHRTPLGKENVKLDIEASCLEHSRSSPGIHGMVIWSEVADQYMDAIAHTLLFLVVHLGIPAHVFGSLFWDLSLMLTIYSSCVWFVIWYTLNLRNLLVKYHPNDRSMIIWTSGKESSYLVQVSISRKSMEIYVLGILPRFHGFLDRCSLQHHQRPWRVCRGVSRRVQPVVVSDAPWTNCWWVAYGRIWLYDVICMIFALYGYMVLAWFHYL